jgi:hypothetical protein
MAELILALDATEKKTALKIAKAAATRTLTLSSSATRSSLLRPWMSRSLKHSTSR